MDADLKIARREFMLGGLGSWLVSMSASPCAATAPHPAEPDPAEPHRRRLRFTMTLRNPGTEPLTDQAVWIYMPLHETSTQSLERLGVSMPHQLERDALGHSILHLAWSQIPPMAVKVVAIQAELLIRAEAAPLALSAPDDWLQSESLIESDDPAIRELAARLRRDSAMQTLDAIYDWVRTNLRYAGYLADSLGARQALLRRSGDCTEYACLAAALARANGIPARMVGGFVASGDAAPRADEYHDWTEVHVEGAWRVLDAQKECWRRNASDYVGFRIHSDRFANAIGSAHRFRVQGRLEVRL